MRAPASPVYAKVTGPSVFACKFLVGLVNIFQKQDRPSGKKKPKRLL